MYYIGKKLAVLLAILAALCPQVRADRVTLKNGDRISGKIVKSDAKTLVISTEFAGELTIAWGAIEQISSDAPLHLRLADGRTVSGLVSMEGERVEVRTEGAPAVTTDRASIQSLRSEDEQRAFDRMQSPGWLEMWRGGANFGLAITSGNSETTNVALGMARQDVHICCRGLCQRQHRRGGGVANDG